MNIQEFFELSAGKWFSHRTNYHLAFNQFEGGKSDIIVEMLVPEHPEVVKLCQQYEIDPVLAVCGARVSWNGSMEGDKEKRSGSTVLVPVPDVDNPSQGKLLREMDDAEKPPVAGRYIMASDQSLTLITEYETMSSEERLWFASPNLRMRVRLLQLVDGFSMASFTSEIRMGGAQPSARAVEAFNQGARS